MDVGDAPERHHVVLTVGPAKRFLDLVEGDCGLWRYELEVEVGNGGQRLCGQHVGIVRPTRHRGGARNACTEELGDDRP